MKKSVQMIAVLGLVSLISGASLVFVYNYATPLIEANQKEELRAAIFNIVPGGARYEEKAEGAEAYFEIYDKGGGLLGYAFIAEGNGYQGNIKIIAGIKRDLSTLYGIEVLDSVETPGLGGEITSGRFRKQFVDLVSTPSIECVKEAASKKNEIQAITGATISSQSVANILNAKIAALREILK